MKSECLKRACTFGLGGLLSRALERLLALLLLLLGVNLGDAGVLEVVKLILGLGIALHHLNLTVGRGEVVTLLLRVVVAVLVIVVMVVLVGRDNVVAGEVDVVVSNNLEEDLLILIDSELESLLVILFSRALASHVRNTIWAMG